MEPNEKNKLNYEKDLKIDVDALDIECADQASTFMQYAKNAAQMRKELDESKQALDIEKAGLDGRIRKNPENYDIEKVTEGAIQSSILNNKRYQELYQKFLDVKYETDMAQSAVIAFNQKKDMLETLVKLHGQSYFAGPSVPRDLSKERELKQKQTSGRIASKLVRNKH